MKKNKDIFYIKKTFLLAKKSKGFEKPNPKVGAVIVKDNKVIGIGYHKEFGKDHAEIIAIKNAKENNFDLKNSTIYSSLSPCTKKNKTNACINEIIKHKIKKVVFSVLDPSQNNVIGILKKNNIEVIGNVLEDKGKELIKDFLFSLKNKVYVKAKIAMTLDGKIATKNYDSKWITNKKTITFSKKKRSNQQAILVGIKTILMDNPNLNIPNKNYKSPTIIVFDPNFKINKNLNIFKNNSKKIIFVSKKKYNPLKNFPNTKIITINKNIFDLNEILKKLYQLNIKSLLIEGGSFTVNSFIKENLVNEFDIYIGSKITGDINAISAFNFQSILNINSSKNYKINKIKQINDNIYINILLI